MIKTQIKSVEKLELVFAKAISLGDKNTLLRILSDTGKFQIQDKNLETIPTDKETFISWILNKKESAETIEFYFDQCLLCKIGNPVVIFNDGQFPSVQKDSSGINKTGIMLNINDNQINEIRFCYTFLKTENKYQFEIKAAMIKQYMCDHNCSFDVAYYKV